MANPAGFRSPVAGDIIAWRDHLAIRYGSQLGELLSWDEASDYSKSEDVAPGADLLLRYVAAVVDERGPQAIHSLVGADKPAHDEIHRALGGVDRRGCAGRFPQLLLVPEFWLPFQQNMIIEEPDWQGETKQFGSNFWLAEEIRELRALITDADPRSVDWTPERDVPTKVLWAAWHASETIARVCAAATSRHLPFWTTG
jgi:hypothetical protein